jgi:hypothetical protein
LTQSHIPLRELWPFKAAKIMAVMRLVRGYRRPYLLLGSGIWANISSRLCPEGTGSMAPPPPSLHREAARPPPSQAAPWLYFSHLVRFTPSSRRTAPWQSAPSPYLLIGFSPIIPNSQKNWKALDVLAQGFPVGSSLPMIGDWDTGRQPAVALREPMAQRGQSKIDAGGMVVWERLSSRSLHHRRRGSGLKPLLQKPSCL